MCEKNLLQLYMQFTLGKSILLKTNFCPIIWFNSGIFVVMKGTLLLMLKDYGP